MRKKAVRMGVEMTKVFIIKEKMMAENEGKDDKTTATKSKKPLYENRTFMNEENRCCIVLKFGLFLHLADFVLAKGLQKFKEW